MKADIYQILGISDNVPDKAVKKAYREFAKMNHPDLYPGDKVKEDRFKQVTSAYRSWLLIEKNMSEVRKIGTHSEGSRPLFGMGQCAKEYERVMEMVYKQHIGKGYSIYGDVGLLRRGELYA